MTSDFSLVNIDFSMAVESSEETITRVLSSYELGRKLRQLRLRKKIALVDLGKHTGLSASMLSQLETGKMVPTLPTLARIAMVFDVGLDHFFDSRQRQKLFTVVRSGERIRFPERPDAPSPAYFFECLVFSAQGKGMQAYLAEFPKRRQERATEHFHDGSEFIYVLEGAMSIRRQHEEHELQAGDSVYFDASEPHSYRGTGKTGARAIVIAIPPRL
ncbi:MAG: XRE family transcriptional regulator [Acidobacteriota bacterium]|nr:XRE family transcriptional regulator [Acidobacteriota bacterium]